MYIFRKHRGSAVYIEETGAENMMKKILTQGPFLYRLLKTAETTKKSIHSHLSTKDDDSDLG